MLRLFSISTTISAVPIGRLYVQIVVIFHGVVNSRALEMEAIIAGVAHDPAVAVIVRIDPLFETTVAEPVFRFFCFIILGDI